MHAQCKGNAQDILELVIIIDLVIILDLVILDLVITISSVL